MTKKMAGTGTGVSDEGEAPHDRAMLLDAATVAVMLSCSRRNVYSLSDGGRMPAPTTCRGSSSSAARRRSGSISSPGTSTLMIQAATPASSPSTARCSTASARSVRR